MAIKEKLVLEAQVGSALITIDEWAAATLSAEQLPLFTAAKQRHNDFIASKAISVDHVEGEVVFADETKQAEANPLDGDMDFLLYWYRYLTENGITVNKTVETI